MPPRSARARSRRSIADIEDKLSAARRSSIRRDLSGDKVVFGATVTLLDEDDKPVTLPDRRPDRGGRQDRAGSRYNSPLGRALIGRKVDDEVEVTVPSGDRYYVVSQDRVHLSLMQFFETRATAIITIVTVIVSGLSGAERVAWRTGRSNAGFIPLRMTDLGIPSEHMFVVPSWATPLTATLIHGGWAHLALNLVMLVYCGQFVEKALGTVGVGRAVRASAPMPRRRGIGRSGLSRPRR